MEKKQYIDMKYDKQFELNSKLTWLPFVGKDYDTCKTKWLIVGERHYIPDGEDRSIYINKDWTRVFILKNGLQVTPWFKNEKKNILTREIEKTLLNKNDSKVWNSLSFYNLSQRLLESRKERPSYKDIVEGLSVFIDVVSILKPDKIIFFGVESAKHFQLVLDQKGVKVIPNNQYTEKINGTNPKRFDLKLDDQTIKCLFIRNPGNSFTACKWHELIIDL